MAFSRIVVKMITSSNESKQGLHALVPVAGSGCPPGLASTEVYVSMCCDYAAVQMSLGCDMSFISAS